MEPLRGEHAPSARTPRSTRHPRLRRTPLALSAATFLSGAACAPHYVPFVTDSVQLFGAVAAPGEGVAVALGVGATWIELDVRNAGRQTLWVSIDGVTTTGPDGREHLMVESAALNAVAAELAGAPPGYRAMTRDQLLSFVATEYSPSAGQPRGVGERTASIEPGEHVQLLLHPIEYVRLDGSGITPFPAPFWGGYGDEGGELSVVLPVSWGRTWGRLEIVGRVGGVK